MRFEPVRPGVKVEAKGLGFVMVAKGKCVGIYPDERTAEPREPARF